jgi:hypothetical protein
LCGYVRRERYPAERERKRQINREKRRNEEA